MSEHPILPGEHVTRDGGTTQTASDATSITRYYKRSESLTGLPVVSDAVALTIAQALLAKYKEPQLRIIALELVAAKAELIENIFRRDLGDRIRVFRTPPGGFPRIDKQLFVQKIEIAGRPQGRVAGAFVGTVRLGVSD